MALNALQVEAITQSVLLELRSRGVSVANAKSTTSMPATKVDGVAVSVRNSETLKISDKVITEDVLAAACAPGQTITIPAGAIVTPSGRDFIRRNEVTITSRVASAAKDTTGKVIIIGECSAAASAATTARWELIKAGCERDAATKVQGSIGVPIVCCGGIGSITACLLNRNEQIRAAVANPETNMQQLIAGMQPHVLCLESAWAFSAMLKLLRTFSVVTADPNGWKELSR